MDLGRKGGEIYLVLLAAILTRGIGVIITTITDLNSYSEADANNFARSAEFIAEGFHYGVIRYPEWASSTYRTWGGILSPFWLIPGPSRVYARIGVAILGVIAIYNVYVICRSIASSQAATFAILPMLFFPSFVFLHTAILREAAVLFGITTAARCLIAPGPRLSRLTCYTLATIALWFATILRSENLVIYLTVLAIAFTLKYRQKMFNWIFYYVGGGLLVLSSLTAVPQMQNALETLVRLRQARARGRTEYLGWVMPESIPEAVALSGIGAMYFLFTPFPWMIGQLADFIAALEAVGNLLFTIAALFGVRTVIQKNLHVGVALISGIILGVILYGLGTVNVGTAVRHRQMVLWAIFLLGGIGISQHIHPVIFTEEPSSKESYNHRTDIEVTSSDMNEQ